MALTPEQREAFLNPNGGSGQVAPACERCGSTNYVARSWQFGGEALCARCVAERYRDNRDEPTTTWAPVDLAPVLAGEEDLNRGPAMLARSDGEHLVYAGKIHSVAGEPESGKGWLALHCVMERLHKLEVVLYIDFEDEVQTVVGRLLAMGVDPELIRIYFRYVRPDEPLSDDGRAELEEILDEDKPRLAVIDGLTDALAIDGIDLRDNTEVANWMRGVPTMLRNRGVAVLINDHVTKDSESRGRWAIGAQHKLAKVDVAYHLRVEEPLGRGLVGRVLIRVQKDRPGHVRRLANGRTVAEMVAAGDGDGTMKVTIRAVDRDDDSATFRPTGYMERVSRALEAEPGLSLRKVRDAVMGRGEYIDRALEVLTREEWIEMRPEGSAQCHYVLRPYREDEDLDRVPNRVPTVSREPQGDHLGDRVPVSPPYRGHGTRTQWHRVPRPCPGTRTHPALPRTCRRWRRGGGMSADLRLNVPPELIEAIAARAAELVGKESQSNDDGWLRGAKKIAAYIDSGPGRVYALSSLGRIPVEHDGSTLIARRSELDAWLRNGGGKRA